MSEPVPDLRVSPAAPCLAPKERWSRPVGVFSLCVAAFWIMFTCIQALEVTLTDHPPYTLIRVRSLVECAFAGLAGISLLLGAILILRRRPLAWDFFIVFGSIGLLFGLWCVGHEAMGSYRMTASPAGGNFVTHLGSILMTALLTLAYPVFVLSWFFREKVREDVKSWARPKTTENAP